MTDISHKVFSSYVRMAHGLPWLEDGYSDEIIEREVESGSAAFGLVWHEYERDLNKILEAKKITRKAFMKTLAFPKPSVIENLIYCDYLRTKFDLTDLDGFANGVYQLPKESGIMVPEKKLGQITCFRFYRWGEMFRPKEELKRPHKAPSNRFQRCNERISGSTRRHVSQLGRAVGKGPMTG